MSSRESTAGESSTRVPHVPLEEQPCPFCDAVGTLERFARSEWYVCTACTRSLLISNGRLARRGTNRDPWKAALATLICCAILLWPSIAPAEMPRVGVRVRTCENGDCSKRAGITFSRSTSRHVLELQVPRHAANRRLVVALYCDGLIVDGPAEMPHEGESAFPIRTREYRRLEPGNYVAVAVLTTAAGEEFRAAPVAFTVLAALP